MSETIAPRPNILSKLPLDRHGVIEASAGTGKTYTLEHLVIELLLSSDATLPEILVVTFTEKAATELRVRLRAKIESLLVATRDQANTHRVHESEPGQSFWTIDEAAKKKLQKALLGFDQSAVSTIHAFCQRLLFEQAFAQRRLFEQDLVDGPSMFRETFLELLRTRFAREDPWKEHLRCWLSRSRIDDLVELLHACHDKRGSFATRYDPGAVATSVALLRTLDLSPHALRPAFAKAKLHAHTSRALLERIAHLRDILRPEVSGPELLRRIQEAEDSSANGFLGYLTKSLSEIRGSTSVDALREGLSRLKATLVPWESAVVQLFLPPIQEELQLAKAHRGAFDFDDMLSLLELSLLGPGGEDLRAAIRSRFRYALIDEFQDTDESQWQIFRLVFLDGGSDNTLFVIGDPKQAIYGFRGADVATYLAAKREILTTHGSIVHLTQNHRSTPKLIDALNRLLDQSAKQPFFTGPIRYDDPVEAAGSKQIQVEREQAPVTPVRILRVTSPEGRTSQRNAKSALARKIAEEIAAYLREEIYLVVDGERQPVRAQDIFILTRSAREGLEVASALRHHSIPHAFYKQDGLFQTSEAIDIRSLLSAIQDPHTRTQRLRAWLTPFFGVEAKDLPAFLELPGSHPLMARLLDWKGIADRRDFAKLFNSILEETRIIERRLFVGHGEREITNYLHVFEVLLEEATRTRATITELVQMLTGFIRGTRLPRGQEGNLQRLESEQASVQIMTMHKSKGLEASVVFLFGGLDMPESSVEVYHEGERRCLHVGDHVPEAVLKERREENQRLLYVAVTRARARLYLPYFGFAETGDRTAPKRREIHRLEGPYQEINHRLDEIVASWEQGADRDLFSVENVFTSRESVEGADALVEAHLASWEPGAELRSGWNDREEKRRLRESIRSPTITSYSRIKASRGGYTFPGALASPPLPESPDSKGAGQSATMSTTMSATMSASTDDPENSTFVPSDADLGGLPSGSTFGRFVHELLEHVPLASLRTAADSELWAAQPEISAVVERIFERHGVAISIRYDVEKLLHAAYTSPLQLGETKIEGGIASADHAIREMEFLYPVPEASHPLLGRRSIDAIDAMQSIDALDSMDSSAASKRGDDRAFVAERGFVKGFIDLVFEHEGRFYVVDWKTDVLPSYSPDAMQPHVEQNYLLQADLYTLALVRHLSIQTRVQYERLFGGVAYCFVRGMLRSPDGCTGVYFLRPTFEAISASEIELVDNPLPR